MRPNPYVSSSFRACVRSSSVTSRTSLGVEVMGAGVEVGLRDSRPLQKAPCVAAQHRFLLGAGGARLLEKLRSDNQTVFDRCLRKVRPEEQTLPVALAE